VRISRVVGFVLAVISFGGATAGAQVSVLGPETLVRMPGRTQTFSRTLDGLDTSVQYTLRIENGGAADATRIGAGTVSVNGVQIVGPNELNANMTVFESQLTLSVRSEIGITILGGPSNSFIRVTLTAPYAAAGTIGPAGGDIAVTNPGSPIYGTRVAVPPGAIEPADAQISLTFSDSLPASFPIDVRQVSAVFSLETSATYNFQLPLRVTIPLNRVIAADEVPAVFFWSETQQKYRPVTVEAIDREARTVTFRTAHFSSFVAIVLPGAAALMSQVNLDTGFRPAVDGFQHPNFGTYQSPGGNCYALALYSAWYYADKKDVDGEQLYGQYDEGVRGQWQDNADERELIGRTYVAASQYWANVWTQISYTLRPSDTALEFFTALMVTKEPQVLLIRIKGGNGHAVTVYGWNANAGQFLIYDNNSPGEVVTLNWSLSGGFTNYSKQGGWVIEQFAFDAFTTLIHGNELEKLYSGVEQGWPSSTYATIAISTPSPEADDTIKLEDDPNSTVFDFEGSVSGGGISPPYVVAYINGSKLGVLSVVNGKFSLSVPEESLNAATNALHLRATINPSDQWDKVRGYSGFKAYNVSISGNEFFINPSFETGDFTGWIQETHTWQNQTPGSVQPAKSALLAQGPDPIDPSIQTAYVGMFSARVNNSDPNFHVSSVSQTATVPQATRPEIRFSWAAVLEDPQHAPSEQPYVDIQVRDETTGEVVYSKHFFSNDPAYSGWRTVRNSSTWRTTAWQQVVISLDGRQGHDLTIRVTAADCSLGGHGGYAYLDGSD
jgi:hypothetical protein